jgi:hypothetical protein
MPSQEHMNSNPIHCSWWEEPTRCYIYNFMTEEERLNLVLLLQPLISESEKKLDTFLKENDPSKRKTWTPSTFRKMNKLVKEHNTVIKQHNKIVLPEFRAPLV